MQDHEDAAKRLRAAKDEIAKFRMNVARLIDPGRFHEDIRSQIRGTVPREKLHDAIDAMLATGDGYDLLILTVAIEQALRDAADDHDAKAKSPIRLRDQHKVAP